MAATITALSTSTAIACMGTGTAGSGFTPISISATEASTANVMELVRRRREEVIQPAALAEPVGPTTATPTPSTPPASTPTPKTLAPKRKATPSAAPARVSTKDTGYEPKYLDEGAYPAPGYAETKNGVWARIYGDYEHREGLSLDPGDSSDGKSQTRSYGALAGADWAVRPGMRFGVFGGYNSSHTTYSNGQFDVTFSQEGVDQIEIDPINRTNTEQDVDGGIFGLYGSYVHDRWSVDMLLKADIFTSKKTETLSLDAAAGCVGAAETPIRRGEDLDFVNYVAQTDFSYKLDLDQHEPTTPRSAIHWLEPFVGFRYTHTDYTSASQDDIHFSETIDPIGPENRGRIGMDTEDGNVLRLHGGVRLRSVWLQDNGLAWSTTLTGMLYSDVIVDGFVVGTGGTSTIAEDEGKLRALAAFTLNGDLGDGLSLITQVEARGGEDYYGFGGQVGLRYQW